MEVIGFRRYSVPPCAKLDAEACLLDGVGEFHDGRTRLVGPQAAIRCAKIVPVRSAAGNSAAWTRWKGINHKVVVNVLGLHDANRLAPHEQREKSFTSSSPTNPRVG